MAAIFRHLASRNLDPQLHTHSVVANMTRNAEGEWRSADFIKIERAKHLIGAHYRGELKRRLEALGYATEQTMVGSVPGFEIAGYDKATLRAFSTRRAEALAWVKERNLDSRSAAVMQQAVVTPHLMAELVDWVGRNSNAREIHPLLAIAILVVVLLEIHPFQDGNGRLSRILTTLLLLRTGYGYVPYGSLKASSSEPGNHPH